MIAFVQPVLPSDQVEVLCHPQHDWYDPSAVRRTGHLTSLRGVDKADVIIRQPQMNYHIHNEEQRLQIVLPLLKAEVTHVPKVEELCPRYVQYFATIPCS